MVLAVDIILISCLPHKIVRGKRRAEAVDLCGLSFGIDAIAQLAMASREIGMMFYAE